MKFLSYNISWSKQYKIDWLFTNKDIDTFIDAECGNSHNVAVPNDLLLAVWPTKIKGVTSDSYIDIFLEILEYYKEYSSQFKTVIIGDCNIISSSKRTGKDNPYPIFDWMKEQGLKSAHHAFLNETYGKESLPTYFHQFKETCKFFIDYAFTNTDIVNYKLYTWDETNRMSDHVPIAIELK